MTEARAGGPDRQSGRPPVWSDPSFTDWLRRHPELGPIERYLPAASTPAFAGEDRLAALQSSYAERGYGRLFYALIRTLTPRQCVEIGIFQGFSLLAAAAALRDNDAGNIAGYDLFGDYPYRHAEQPLVAAQIAASGLQAWTTLHHANVAQVNKFIVEIPAGSLLYMPAGWFHHVKNMGPTVMVNFWTRSTQQVGLIKSLKDSARRN